VKSNCPNTQTNTPDRFSIWTTKAVDNKVAGIISDERQSNIIVKKLQGWVYTYTDIHKYMAYALQHNLKFMLKVE